MKNEKNQKPAVQNPHLAFDAQMYENEVWLTTQDAMKLLNVSRSTIYRMRKKDNIPCLKLGSSPMYPKHLLNKLFMHKALNNAKNL